MTTSAAAEYLAAHGFTVRSKRDGTDKPPNSTTVKQWCERGKIEARKSGWAWLISQRELDRIITANVANERGGPPGADKLTAPERRKPR